MSPSLEPYRSLIGCLFKRHSTEYNYNNSMMETRTTHFVIVDIEDSIDSQFRETNNPTFDVVIYYIESNKKATRQMSLNLLHGLLECKNNLYISYSLFNDTIIWFVS